jgi:molybdate transport system substrate-binding protein
MTPAQTRLPPADTTVRRRHGPGLHILACLALFLAACGNNRAAPKHARASPAPPEPSNELRIAAASDLKFVLIDLATIFGESHPDATITFTPGSSGSFFAQLSNDAPFDMFLSADVAYPQKLVEQGQATKGSEFEYAVGHLVVWVPNGSRLDVEQKGIKILRDEAVRKIAVANPKTAPYGRAAIAALKHLGDFDALQPRLVYGENVAQTAQLVESGGADAGIIALSLAVSPVLRGRGRYSQIPEEAHPPIVQGGVVLRWAQDAALASEFRDFLLSSEGSVIFRKYGFSPAGE